MADTTGTRSPPARNGTPWVGRFASLLFAICMALVPPGVAEAADDPIRIGVLTDMEGIYSDIMGAGSIDAAKLAIEDFNGMVLGRKIELVTADHQNKADLGATIARNWIDTQDVGLLIDMGNSAVALAVQEVVRAKNRVAIYTAASTTALTQKSCAPTGFSWLYDAYALSAGLSRSLVAQGRDTWYFLAVDFAFGQSMQEESSKAVLGENGKVLGSLKVPQGSADFSSFLLSAAGSKAKAVELILSGTDLRNALKQADEFGMKAAGQTLVTPLVFIRDIHSMGLQATQANVFVTAYYWDRNDETRRFSRRYFERTGGMPTMAQAGVYSGVRHYLRAVQAAGAVATEAVVAKMRELKVDDSFAPGGWLREDGRLMHDLYLVQVKTPAESKTPWDYYKILATIPAEQAFQPLSASQCPLVKR